MNENKNPSMPQPDDVLVEALRDAYQPAPLAPLRRARIRANVRARVADEHDVGNIAPRSGWGLVPAAAALAGVLLAIGMILGSGRDSVREIEGPTGDELSAAALLLGDSLVLDSFTSDDSGDSLLPADYQAIAQLLGASA